MRKIIFACCVALFLAGAAHEYLANEALAPPKRLSVVLATIVPWIPATGVLAWAVVRAIGLRALFARATSLFFTTGISVALFELGDYMATYLLTGRSKDFLQANLEAWLLVLCVAVLLRLRDLGKRTST